MARPLPGHRAAAVKLLLDAHVSGKRVGAGLCRHGHDVRAVDEERALEGLGDDELLALATRDHRVLVTGNARDFVPLIVARASRGAGHAGVLLLPKSIRYEAFGVLIGGIHAALAGTVQEDWRDRLAWVQRA